MKASPAPSRRRRRPAGRRARDLLAVVEQVRALGAVRHGDEPVAARQRVELVAVDDGQVRVDGDGRAGAAFRQKKPVQPSHAERTASSGTSSWQRTASCSGSSTSSRVQFAPGATTICVSPAAST